MICRLCAEEKGDLPPTEVCQECSDRMDKIYDGVDKVVDAVLAIVGDGCSKISGKITCPVCNAIAAFVYIPDHRRVVGGPKWDLKYRCSTQGCVLIGVDPEE